MIPKTDTKHATPLLLPRNPRPKPRILAFQQVNTPAYVAVHVKQVTPDICAVLDQIAGAVARKTDSSIEDAYILSVQQLIDALAQSIGCGAVLFDLNYIGDPQQDTAEEISNIIQLVA